MYYYPYWTYCEMTTICPYEWIILKKTNNNNNIWCNVRSFGVI